VIEYTEIQHSYFQLPYNYNNKSHRHYTFHSIDHPGVMKRATVEIWAMSLWDAARIFCRIHGVRTCVAWHGRSGERAQERLKNVRPDDVTERYTTPLQLESQWWEGAAFQTDYINAERDLFVALELAFPNDLHATLAALDKKEPTQ
jgi:hypothetical protein